MNEWEGNLHRTEGWLGTSCKRKRNLTDLSVASGYILDPLFVHVTNKYPLHSSVSESHGHSSTASFWIGISAAKARRTTTCNAMTLCGTTHFYES